MSKGRAPALPEGAVSTTDIDIAAYWHLHGLELLKIERAGRQNGKSIFARFYFRDPGDLADGLAVRYIGSESFKHDKSKRGLSSAWKNTRKEWRR